MAGKSTAPKLSPKSAISRLSQLPATDKGGIILDIGSAYTRYLLFCPSVCPIIPTLNTRAVTLNVPSVPSCIPIHCIGSCIAPTTLCRETPSVNADN